MKDRILVTGVSRGLGLAIAAQLLRDGYHVLGISRTSTPELAALENEFADCFQFLSFDIGQLDELKTVVFRDFVDQEQPLCGVVNNAALAYDDLVTNLNVPRLQRMFQVNVFAAMEITNRAIRHMLRFHTPGSLVHISSVSVHTGYKGLAMYAASKGALEAFSKNTAREWGARQIRSNTVVAGFMETEMSARLTAEQKQRIYNRTSLKKPVEPRSVAHLVSFLLSHKAASVTGQNLHADAGTV